MHAAIQASSSPSSSFGVSSETAERSSVSIELFTASVKNAVRYIYRAVADPVEGTLLTILSAWADSIDAKRHRIDDFGQLFVASRAILEKALAETPFRLDVLAKANVVDAGASAFVYFIDGIIECIRKKNIRHLVKSTVDKRVKEKHKREMPTESHVPQEVAFRYCTEAIIRNVSLDHNRLSRSYPSMAIPSWLPVQPKPAVCMSTPAIRTGCLRCFSTTEP
jgi:dihydroxyacetone kinase-like predicted kinase